jgi:hypothetical protein
MFNFLYRNKKKYIKELAIDFFLKNQKGCDLFCTKTTYNRFLSYYEQLPSRLKESLLKDINSTILRHRHEHLLKFIEDYDDKRLYTYTVFLIDGYTTVDVNLSEL